VELEAQFTQSLHPSGILGKHSHVGESHRGQPVSIADRADCFAWHAPATVHARPSGPTVRHPRPAAFGGPATRCGTAAAGCGLPSCRQPRTRQASVISVLARALLQHSAT